MKNFLLPIVQCTFCFSLFHLFVLSFIYLTFGTITEFGHIKEAETLATIRSRDYVSLIPVESALSVSDCILQIAHSQGNL